MQQQQSHHNSRLLVAVGATTGALAACFLAHRLWLRHQDGPSLQVLSKSSSSSSSVSAWVPQLLLQRSLSLSAAAGQESPVVYDYAQSIEELLIEAQVPAHIQQQDVCVKFGSTSLLVVVGRQRVIDGCLAGRILPAHSSWKLEGQGKERKLSITLVKQSAASGYVLWDSLLAAQAGAAAAAAAGAAAASDAPKSPERRDQGAKTIAEQPLFA